MLAATRHRARDGQEKFIDPAEGIALAYCHTATFGQSKDIASWHEDQHHVAAVDGDIYQTPRVPDGGDGRFRSKHAGAVIAGYEADEKAFPAGIEGVFSLFLWDRWKRTLYLSADPMGRKLVYYYEDTDCGLVVFSTELKGVLAHPSVRRELDEGVLPLYLAYDIVPAPYTLVKGVRKVMAAECLSFAPAEKKSRRYWRPAYETGPDELDYWVGRVRSELVASVGRIVGDAEKVAVYLSGGMDSATVLAALKELDGPEIGAFTLAFKDSRGGVYDADGAADAARITGTSHQTIVVDVETDVTPELMKTLFKQIDEPFDTASRLVNEHFLGTVSASAGFNSALTGVDPGHDFGVIKKVIEEDGEIGSRSVETALKASFGTRLYFNEERINHAVSHRADMTILHEAPLANLDVVADLDPIRAMVMDKALRSAASFNFLFIQNLPPLMGLEERAPFYDTKMMLTMQSLPAAISGLESSEYERASLRESFRDVFGAHLDQRRKVAFPHSSMPSWLNQMLVPSLKPLAEDGIVTPKYLTWLEKMSSKAEKEPASKPGGGLSSTVGISSKSSSLIPLLAPSRVRGRVANSFSGKFVAFGC